MDYDYDNAPTDPHHGGKLTAEMVAQREREAILEMIHDRWGAAKQAERDYEEDAPDWADIERGKARALQELADAIRARNTST